MDNSVVVYVRVDAIDLANVALWMKEKNIYRMAKPGGVMAKAVKYLAMLLASEGQGPGLQTMSEAQIAFGRLNFPPMRFKVQTPTKLEVQAAGLVALEDLHIRDGLLERSPGQEVRVPISAEDLAAAKEQALRLAASEGTLEGTEKPGAEDARPSQEEVDAMLGEFL